MKKRILAYLKYIDELLEDDDKDWDLESKKHLVQIAFFAHERQVHLIVMALFAIAEIICILYVHYTGSLVILGLALAILILLVPYIMHYYLLENSVQRMYQQYDGMQNKIQNSFHM